MVSSSTIALWSFLFPQALKKLQQKAQTGTDPQAAQKVKSVSALYTSLPDRFSPHTAANT